MLATLGPVFALLASVALLLMGNGLQGTLLPVRAELEAFGTFNIGLLGSSYFIGFAVGCLFGPRFVRRVGHIRSFTALTSVAAAVVLAHAFVVVPAYWLPLRVVTGFCFAGLYVVMESWLNAHATNKTRGTILSIYTMVNLTVITLGQLMITLADPQTFVPFSIAAILISLASVPVAMTKSQAPQPPKNVRLRPLKLYRVSPVGVIGCFAVGLANGPFWTLAPAYGVASGLDTGGVALLMALTVIGGAVGQWPLGRLSDRLDRRWVIFVACCGASLAGFGLVATGLLAPRYLLPTAFGFGVFAIPMYALCVAHTNDFVDAADFVETSGGLLLASALGSVLGPVLASAVMARVGPGGLFASTAVIHVLLAGFVLYRMRCRAAPGGRIPFVAVARTSTGLAALDPRAKQTG